MNGCGRYLRLLEQGTIATDRTQSTYFFRLAREHKESCQNCKRINTPLAEQLFGKKVVIVK